ncbi:cobaltochelatase CobT-related protein [Oleidesulfovibrio sp.]|uniref:cobaltochelatase CobT-related protein n=1 Tax=Oleidesulfovibrio sp. TaxID=2909707 RepID=UPI003A8AC036
MTAIPHRNILHSLPLLASALGRRYGVTIRIGGTEAYTDGDVIQLPALPSDHDETFMGLVRALVDHESAHIRHTDFAVPRSAGSPLERHVWNIFEDWRVENAMAAMYPGCRGNFAWLIRHYFLKNAQEEYNDKTRLVLDWLLLTVRSWDVPELVPQCQSLEVQVDAGWPWLRLHLEAILQAMRGNCPDSAACLQYARQICAVLHVASCGGKSARKNTNKSSILSTQGDAKIAEPPSSTDEAHAQALKQLLSVTEQSLPADLGSMVHTTLAASAKNTPETGATVVAQEARKPTGTLSMESLRSIEEATSGMQARFHGLLQATRLERNQSARRGKLNTRGLYRAAIHDPRLFVQHQKRAAINTAVHILLDCSGSMKKRMPLACQATYAVANALEHNGINVAVTAFPAVYNPQFGWASVSPLVRHGQSVHPKFSLASGGSTPLGPALWWVLQQMLPLNETRKLILIITDGAPDCDIAASDAVSAALRLGYECYGLGIMSCAIEDLLPRTSKTIWNLPQLAPAMFSMLKSALVTV